MGNLYGGMLAVLLSLSLTGCISPCLTGSGNVIQETRDIDSFTAIELNVPAELYLTQENKTSLMIEAEDNLVEDIDTRVSGEVLVIDQKKHFCYDNKEPIKIYVSTRDVEKLTVSGSGKIIGQNEIISDELELVVEGSGAMGLVLNASKLTTSIMGSGGAGLQGTADIHDYSCTGSGKLEAYDLTTEKTTVTITGSGDVEVTAQEELDVEILGSGRVFYKGDARLSQSITGSGDIKHIG